MKHFVLYSSSEMPHFISENEFEKHTKGEEPFIQKVDGVNRYFATCPECENPIQLKGLYTSERKYGAHTGKSIKGLNPFNYMNYICCPRAVKGRHLPRESRKEIVSPKDIAIYNTVRDDFDLIVSFARKHLGFYITNTAAKRCLEHYYASQGWLYPHSTVNNIPFVLFYLGDNFNPHGLLVKKNSKLEKAVLNVADFKLVQTKGNLNKHYNKLLPNSDEYMILTMMLWNHRFAEKDDGMLNESISIEICKDISQNYDRHDWETLLNITIKLPEHEFVRFINSKNTYRDNDLLTFAQNLMKPLNK